MKRRELIVGCLAGSVGFAVRSDAAQKTQGGPQPQRVADAERSFAATMATRDAKAFAAHISEEAIFMGAADAPRVLRGRAAIVEGWRQYFDGPAAPFSWEPDIVEVTDSGSMALTSGPVHDPAGKLVGRFNSIWRLEPDGRWRVLFDRGAPVCG
ncbi:MAG: nuclear transport factor 2 family protein [Vicinamibacterales bacterium]|nr:nuclear transport factor 2 family protein [Vicinamibacterales bacterium]